MLFCSQVNGTEADFEYEEITLERVSRITSSAVLSESFLYFVTDLCHFPSEQLVYNTDPLLKCKQLHSQIFKYYSAVTPFTSSKSVN